MIEKADRIKARNKEKNQHVFYHAAPELSLSTAFKDLNRILRMKWDLLPGDNIMIYFHFGDSLFKSFISWIKSISSSHFVLVNFDFVCIHM